jgi:predicted NBD/HSP70 family sugar kinase
VPDMRFAPPLAMRVPDRGGGLNQTSVRSYNEMLVLSLLRKHGSLSRLVIGQLSGLSAQTISVIVRALERDNLISPGEAQRGRVGPPMTPMSLNPDGAFALGVNIGPTGIDAVLIDFSGAVRKHVQTRYAAPSVGEVKRALRSQFNALTASLPEEWRKRIIGLGVALPGGVEKWPRADWSVDLGESWSQFDFEAELAAISKLPTFIQNDVTAAAGAEVMFGAAREIEDFVYFFITAETESRLVLNHRIYAGRTSNHPGGERWPINQKSVGEVFSTASLSTLEASLRESGLDSEVVQQSPVDWGALGPTLSKWIEESSACLASAIALIGMFVDVRTAILGGRIPGDVLERMCESTRESLAAIDIPADRSPNIRAGEIGAYAKAIGAGSLPFQLRFMVEQYGLAPA